VLGAHTRTRAHRAALLGALLVFDWLCCKPCWASPNCDDDACCCCPPYARATWPYPPLCPDTLPPPPSWPLLFFFFFDDPWTLLEEPYACLEDKLPVLAPNFPLAMGGSDSSPCSEP